jgi:dTDP-4-dehydrorhamnose reductase
MKILLTGGGGLLGSEILKLDSTLPAPNIYEMDITDAASIGRALDKYQPEAVLHLAAATNPPQHEQNPELGLRVNILGTVNIALACLKRGLRLVFPSSDYVYFGKGPHKEDEPVFAPNNFYLSKLGGECAVRIVPNSLVLRLSFGAVPFPWEQVYDSQICSKLYVDEMAPLVLAAVKSGATGIMNLGGPRTTLADYAQRTKKDIQTIPTPEGITKDTSLDISKMKHVLGIADENTLLKH